MMTRCVKLAFCLLMFTAASGQTKWDLRKSVEYALEHNISVRQADVQARIVALTYEQSKLSQYPSLNLQNSVGYQFGRSIDPATNLYTNQEILFANHGANMNMDLFNWFSKKNQIAANRLQAEAYLAGVQKAKDDVALNVANAYLQILLSAEQINISDLTVKQSLVQVDIVRKKVDAGSLPDLSLAELESQLANDSSNLITAKSNYTLSILQLKALLNIPADSAFDVSVPPVATIPLEPISELDPASVYALAVKNLAQQRINDLNLQSAIKNVAAVKGQMYPTFSLFGGLNTNYSNAQRLLPSGFTQVLDSVGFVTIGGTNYAAKSQIAVPNGFSTNPYGKQISNNFSQSIGIGLTIPIFNGGIARTNWKKAKLNVITAELQKEEGELTLKQDIYQAHANAMAALEKFNATKKGSDFSQKAYDFALKRFDVGLLSTIDLITSQNNLFRAKINMLSAQYDYVFKMKLLEFYRGQGLKL